MKNLVINDQGIPVVLAEPKPSKTPAPLSPPPLIDRREILTLRQAAEVLKMAPDDAAALLAQESTARIVGWSAESIFALRQAIERGEVQGIERVERTP